MLVKYNGEYVRESRSGGCSKCGTRYSISGVETYKTVYRTYYDLRLYIFEKGKVYPVDDTLGKFLLGIKTTNPDGTIKSAFEEIPDKGESTYTNTDVEMTL